MIFDFFNYFINILGQNNDDFNVYIILKDKLLNFINL